MDQKIKLNTCPVCRKEHNGYLELCSEHNRFYKQHGLIAVVIVKNFDDMENPDNYTGTFMHVNETFFRKSFNSFEEDEPIPAVVHLSEDQLPFFERMAHKEGTIQ